MSLIERKKLAQLQRRLKAAQERHAEVEKEIDRLDENRDEIRQQLRRVGDLSLGKSSRPGKGIRVTRSRAAFLDRQYAGLLKKDTRFKQKIEGLQDVRAKIDETIGGLESQMKKVAKSKNPKPSPAQLRARRKFAAMARKRARLAKKGNPGKRGLKGATAKQERQYEHIKKSERKAGRPLKDAKSIAAATVRKRANKTIIKARTIKHLDVSKVHNPKRKRNSSVSSKSKSNFRKFHGRPSRKSVTVLAPRGTPSSVAISGPLKSIRTRKVTLNFMKRRNPGSEAMLAEGDNGQLYIVAKGDHLPHGPEPLTDYGPIEQVEYIAKKPHLGYPQTTEFYHKFGEETGVKPHLETNEQGEYIITGGEYYVTDRGIENPRKRKRTVRRRR